MKHLLWIGVLVLGSCTSNGQKTNKITTIDIKKNQVGIILNTKTGKYDNKLLEAGLYHLKQHQEIITYPIDTISEETKMEVLTKDEQLQRVIVTYRYQLQKENIIRLNKEIGKNYEDHALLPSMRKATAMFISEYKKNDLKGGTYKDFDSLRSTLSTKYYIDLVDMEVKIDNPQ